jgi:hypothetical protein
VPRARARIVGLVLIGVGFVAPPALAATPVSSVTANPVSAIEGMQFTAQVGTYTGGCGPSGPTLPGTFVTVNWGDGSPIATPTLDLITGTANCAVVATHTYADEGTYTTTVTAGNSTTGVTESATSTATVADAPLKLAGATVTGTAGVATGGTVATLTDTGGLEPGSDYKVEIDWGDGQTSAGTVTATGNVTGTNTYATAGTYAVDVTVTDVGGQSASVMSTASIGNATPPPCAKSPPTAVPPFTPKAANPDGRWIQAVYHDLLGSTIAPAPLAQLTASMLSGASREVVVAYLEGDPDRPIVVGSEYNAYLARSPTASELSYWTQFLAGGQTDEAMAAQLLGSPEYYADHDATNPGFIAGLYCDLLYRLPDAASLSYWETQLGAGATRPQVAEQVLASTERRQLLVDSLYLRFLRRQPSAADQMLWVTQLQNGTTTDEQIIGELASSQEYFDKFAGGGPTVTSPTINAVGLIHVALAQPATLALRVLLLPAVQKQAAFRLPVPKTRLVGTVPLGHHRAGRVTVHWNLKVAGRRVKPGRYVLILEARRAHKLVPVSDAVAVNLR